MKVTAERRVGNRTSLRDRSFIASLDGEAEQALYAVRTHWEIENCVHWTLDIAFRGDESRVRKSDGAKKMAVLRNIALNLLKQERTVKCGEKSETAQGSLG
jgi:predicted transposase YbfD/YdcC